MDAQPPEKNDHRAVQGLDPGSVDTETPDVNPDQPDQCQVIEATTRDGQPLTFAVHTLAPLSEAEQAMLGQVAQVAAERMARENPYGGVVTELMLAAVHAQVVLRDAGKAERADRLSAAVRAAADVIRAAKRTEPPVGYREQVRAALAETDSGWGEATGDGDANPDYLDTLTESLVYLRDAELEQARTERETTIRDCALVLLAQRDGVAEALDLPRDSDMATLVNAIAELRADAAASEASLDYVRTSLIEHMDVADELSLPDVLSAAWSVVDERDAARIELAELRKRAVTLPGDWHGRIRDCVNQQTANRLVTLIESWRSTPSGWSCKCGMDVTDMVHTTDRCYSATEPITAPVSVSVIVDRATGERHEYPQRSGNECACPGSGTSAHAQGCPLHPESEGDKR